MEVLVLYANDRSEKSTVHIWPIDKLKKKGWAQTTAPKLIPQSEHTNNMHEMPSERQGDCTQKRGHREHSQSVKKIPLNLSVCKIHQFDWWNSSCKDYVGLCTCNALQFGKVITYDVLHTHTYKIFVQAAAVKKANRNQFNFR